MRVGRPRSKSDAIRDIEKGLHSYYVLWNGKQVGIEVVGSGSGKYLRTVGDGTEKNNLLELPDC